MNIVFAGYVPGTGIFVITQQYAEPNDPPCNLVLTQDASGNAIVQAGDASTQVNGGTESQPAPTPGLQRVNVSFINNGHVFTVQAFKGDMALLNIFAGQGTGSVAVKNGSVFKGGMMYSRAGSPLSTSADSQIGASAS